MSINKYIYFTAYFITGDNVFNDMLETVNI